MREGPAPGALWTKPSIEPGWFTPSHPSFLRTRNVVITNRDHSRLPMGELALPVSTSIALLVTFQ